MRVPGALLRIRCFNHTKPGTFGKGKIAGKDEIILRILLLIMMKNHGA